MNNLPRTPAGAGGFVSDVKSWLHRWSDVQNMLPGRSAFVRAQPSVSVNAGLSVLVADDNPSHLMTVSDLLEQCGISALLAADGAEAVHLVCERSFDIVLMDIQMPVLDGLTATSRIRRFEGAHCRPRTPVVAYSTSQLPWNLLAASGMDGWLTKPCNAAELEACLLRWCGGFQPWSAHVR